MFKLNFRKIAIIILIFSALSAIFLVSGIKAVYQVSVVWLLITVPFPFGTWITYTVNRDSIDRIYYLYKTNSPEIQLGFMMVLYLKVLSTVTKVCACDDLVDGPNIEEHQKTCNKCLNVYHTTQDGDMLYLGKRDRLTKGL